jgi:environmental stress-induced protein Ves
VLEERRRQHHQIAVFPQEAGFEAFDWRVSLATIAADGPFSSFPGVERTLALVDGHGMTLDIDGAPTMLSRAEPVAAFDGESHGRGQAEPRSQHRFQRDDAPGPLLAPFGRRVLDGGSTFVARADVTVLFLAEGEGLELCSDDQRINLVRYDAVLLDPDTTWKLQADQGTIFIADIHYYDDEDDLADADGDYE